MIHIYIVSISIYIYTIHTYIYTFVDAFTRATWLIYMREGAGVITRQVDEACHQHPHRHHRHPHLPHPRGATQPPRLLSLCAAQGCRTHAAGCLNGAPGGMHHATRVPILAAERLTKKCSDRRGPGRLLGAAVSVARLPALWKYAAQRYCTGRGATSLHWHFPDGHRRLGPAIHGDLTLFTTASRSLMLAILSAVTLPAIAPMGCATARAY